MQKIRYLIIGSGRVAVHFARYLSYLKLPYHTWSRQAPIIELQQKLTSATHVLLLINDSVLEAFALEYLSDSSAILLHFSGNHVSEKLFGAHPLFTFSHQTYALSEYLLIPFVIDDDAPEFDVLLPGLKNPHVRISKTLKKKYHSICVLAGNFSCLLWQKLFSTFTNEFNFPAEIAHPYLKKQMMNLIAAPDLALTGPLVRKDKNAINEHLEILKGDPFYTVYASFVSCYEKLNEDNKK